MVSSKYKRRLFVPVELFEQFLSLLDEPVYNLNVMHVFLDEGGKS